MASLALVGRGGRAHGSAPSLLLSSILEHARLKLARARGLDAGEEISDSGCVLQVQSFALLVVPWGRILVQASLMHLVRMPPVFSQNSVMSLMAVFLLHCCSSIVVNSPIDSSSCVFSRGRWFSTAQLGAMIIVVMVG